MKQGFIGLTHLFSAPVLSSQPLVRWQLQSDVGHLWPLELAACFLCVVPSGRLGYARKSAVAGPPFLLPSLLPPSLCLLPFRERGWLLASCSPPHWVKWHNFHVNFIHIWICMFNRSESALIQLYYATDLAKKMLRVRHFMGPKFFEFNFMLLVPSGIAYNF